MVARPDQPPLIVILGETASGKSALAIDLALKFNGEIIAADSRTIYKGMDIGTAKADSKEQKLVPHHLIDLYLPDQPINVARFKQLAETAISDVTSRGKLPFLVGGSGLYINSIVFQYPFSGEADRARRKELLSLSVAELQAELNQQRIKLPSNYKNPRHLIRQLETGGVVSSSNDLRENTLLIGLQTDLTELQSRVEARVESMFDRGLAREAAKLLAEYGNDCTTLDTIGYKEFKAYINDGAHRIMIGTVKREIIRNTLRYAKRQRTWFRRNKSIHWICKKDEAVDLIATFLNKVSVV